MKKNKEGIILLVALLFLGCSAILAGSYIALSDSYRNWSQRELNREQAFCAAESGVEVAAENIATNLTIPYVNALVYGSGSNNGVGYSYAISSVSNLLYVYAIDSTAGVAFAASPGKGVRRAVHVKYAQKPSWADYALWYASNPSGASFIGGDVFNGPVYTMPSPIFNETIPSGGSTETGAVFYALMSTSAATNSGTMTGTTFFKGEQFNSAQGTMADVSFPNLLAAAQANGLVVTGNTAITLTGSVAKISNTRKGWTNYSYSIVGEGLIYVAAASSGTATAATLNVGGQLDARLTIVTDNDIYITNNLTYKNNPATNSASLDELGLVSKADIYVQTNAPNNLQVYAGMVATGQLTNSPGSFAVVNYSTRSVSSNLNVYGSIVQDERGAVGTFSGSNLASGFNKKYTWDTRFATVAPPYYPTVATKITYSSWWESGVPW